MPKDGTVHELTSNVRDDDLNHPLWKTASEGVLKRALGKLPKLRCLSINNYTITWFLWQDELVTLAQPWWDCVGKTQQFRGV